MVNISQYLPVDSPVYNADRAAEPYEIDLIDSRSGYYAGKAMLIGRTRLGYPRRPLYRMITLHGDGGLHQWVYESDQFVEAESWYATLDGLLAPRPRHQWQ